MKGQVVADSPFCRLPRLLALLLAVLVGLAAATAQGGKFNEALNVGDAAPVFGELTGIDDQPHGLAEYDSARIVVLVFTSNRCPVATAYQDRLKAIQEEYADERLQVVAVNVGRGAAESLPKMKERAAAAGFNFPYLLDAERHVARAYGVTATPQVFLLDAQRNVAYMGRIDDATEEREVKRRFLLDAIRAVLAGERPEVIETRPVGCAIETQ
jgi:peroxiredoxin